MGGQARARIDRGGWRDRGSRRWWGAVAVVVGAATLGLVGVDAVPAAAGADADYGAFVSGMHDLKHYWRLSSSTSAAPAVSSPDSVGVAAGGLPLQGTGVVVPVSGAWGGSGDGAGEFDGTAGLGTNSGGATRIGSNASVDLWVKPAVLPAPVSGPEPQLGRAIVFDTAERDSGGVYAGKGFLVEVDSNGRVWGRAGFEGQPVTEVVATSSTLVVPGRWYHLNVTWVATGELRLSVDGTKEAAVPGPQQSLEWDYGGWTGTQRLLSHVAVGGGASAAQGAPYSSFAVRSTRLRWWVARRRRMR